MPLLSKFRPRVLLADARKSAGANWLQHGLRTAAAPGRPAVALGKSSVATAAAAAAAATAAAGPTPADDGTSTSPAAPPKAWDPLAWWRVESPKESEHSIAASDTSHVPAEFGTLVKKLVSLCAPDKVLVCFAVFHMLVAAAAELAIPHFATTSIFAAGAAGATMETVLPHIKTLGALVLIYGSFAGMRGFCFSILNNRMILRMRMSLFQNLTQRETAFFDGVSVGALTSRLQSDCQAISKCFSINFNISLRNFIQATGGFIYLWVLSKKMCLVTLGISVILWAVTLAYGSWARYTQRINQDVMACANQVADEVMSLSRLVRGFGTEVQELKRYSHWLGRFYHVGLRQAGGYSAFILLGHITCYACKVVALFLGCTMVVRGELSSEQLTNYIFYTEFVVYSSLNVCDEFTEVMEAMGASERVLKLLDGKPAPQLSSTQGKVLDWSGLVSFQDVTFRYPGRPSHTALSHVTIDFKPGTLTALVGPSGSGKSSVVMLTKRLYDPDEGSILLDGVDMRDVDPDWYRSQIGVVSQEPALFEATVAENIAYGCSRRCYLELGPQDGQTTSSSSAAALAPSSSPSSSPLSAAAASSSAPPPLSSSPSSSAAPPPPAPPAAAAALPSSSSSSAAAAASTSSSLPSYIFFSAAALEASSLEAASLAAATSAPHHSSSSSSSSSSSPSSSSPSPSSSSSSPSLPSSPSPSPSTAKSEVEVNLERASKSWPSFEALAAPPTFPEDQADIDSQPSAQEIEDAARQANAHDFIMALPQGYQTMITDKLLSGGQKQRIALARALIRKPKLLVLDEATSALDAESEAQVQAALDEAMQLTDRSVIVIAHRLSTVRKADRIVVMDNGQVVEVGTHESLLQKRGMYWSLVLRQSYSLEEEDAELLMQPA